MTEQTKNKIEYYCRNYFNCDFLDDRRERISNLYKIKNEIMHDTLTVKSPILSDLPSGMHDNESNIERYIVKKEQKLESIDYSINREKEKLMNDIIIMNEIDDVLKELNQQQYEIFCYKYRDKKEISEICYLIYRTNKTYKREMNAILEKINDRLNL